MTDFDTQALYAALDAERQARGLSWPQARAEINAAFAEVPGHRSIAMSTIRGVEHRNEVEGDGVLQMLLWLDRTPESFVPGCADADAERYRLRVLEPNRILRFDTRALHVALAEKRAESALSWKAMAEAIGTGSASPLQNLARGGRTGIRNAVRIALWLDRPTADFTRVSDW